MKSKILQLAGNLRESYWFIPSLMTAGALLLAFGMIYIDGRFGSAWMNRLEWLYAARPDGARGLLSAVGGSMIGVAGTTFSVTIAAVVYASGQYGPRLLTNFMADRGNQVTLGTFIATFLYTIVVLRSVRSPGENGGGIGAFVPQQALLVALLLVIASIVVLIYFIHHVPQRIHINSVIERIGTRLLAQVKEQFPSDIGEPGSSVHSGNVPAALRDEGTLPATGIAVIRARSVGYIRLLDEAVLMQAARDRDIVVRLRRMPGDFVHPGTVLAWAAPVDRCDEDIESGIAAAFTLGSRRTPLQDIRFLIDELVEIAARALSPGINDPFTANTCLDWLTAAFVELATRTPPSPLREDAEGNLRMIAMPQGFDTLMMRGFDALAQYASADRIAAARFLDAARDVAIACPNAERRIVVATSVERFRALACTKLDGPLADDIATRAAAVLAEIGRQPSSRLRNE